MSKFILFVVLSILIASSLAHNSVKLRKNKIKQVGGAIECSICSWLVGEVQTYVAENQTETEIETAIENDCGVFGPLDGLCKTLVDDAVPDIINYLNQNYPPSQICDALNLCGSTTTGSSASSSGALGKTAKKVTTPKKAPKIKSPQGLQCTVCEYVVTQVDTYLENNNTIEEIEQLLDNDCQIFGPFSGTCTTLVNTYLPDIVNLLEQDYPPDVVCSILGVCGNSSSSSSGGTSGTSGASSSPATSSTSSGAASNALSGVGENAKILRKVTKKLKKTNALKNKIKISNKRKNIK